MKQAFFLVSSGKTHRLIGSSKGISLPFMLIITYVTLETFTHIDLTSLSGFSVSIDGCTTEASCFPLSWICLPFWKCIWTLLWAITNFMFHVGLALLTTYSSVTRENCKQGKSYFLFPSSSIPLSSQLLSTCPRRIASSGKGESKWRQRAMEEDWAEEHSEVP